ncbi:type II toxin-antitoxin system prevent-host-death family antitoxin [Aestuariicoccus sp. MJ-SS9]|uniref:type II toxin-antitoxin system Phd/YefM family antitoxin n=1 Tax=Aestuariicoccus sp. MJ-SS9 TaxID=3079855 RepID=UPI00290D4AED|nr:type II toxin-antitoxin system prevent-host-death family antitoxin [Aestuariicoccus sp. MJ-SS9]MDU8913861.1 type II toxin-antitoxin system prevent-host-death family antitoxin [Aestuariicoccus sp. MJ-SS9]
MQFSVHTAKTQLSRLIDAALAGEEVVIAKGSKPVVRLVPVAQSGFRLGMCKGRFGPLPDFLEPEPEDMLEAWEGGA